MPRTHGPRLNRERCRQVVDKLGLKVTESNGLGIHIERYGNDIGYQIWRVYTGGGIAGNSDQAWLAPVFKPNGEARGPFWNKGQLERALRQWRREFKPIGWRTKKKMAMVG